MYVVVGCDECRHLWIVEGRPETSECPRCGTRRAFDRRRHLYRSEDADAAREARGRLLAERSGHGEAFASVEDFASLEAAVADGVIDVDRAPAESVGPTESADATTGHGGSPREVVRGAIESLPEPTRAEVVAYAAKRDVPAERASRTLDRLQREGEIVTAGDRYRLVRS